MFEVELIGLLNKFKSAQTDYDKNLMRNSIKNLCLQNKLEFERFVEKEGLDDEVREILNTIRIEISSNEALNESSVSKNEEDSDLEKIKKAYLGWRDFFVNNNREPNSNCEKVVVDLIMFYAPNRFEVLKRVLKIVDDNDYESFKNMLKNYLRTYFCEKIEKKYRSLKEDKSVGFFELRNRKKKIVDVLTEIGKYEFNEKKIMEVLGER